MISNNGGGVAGRAGGGGFRREGVRGRGLGRGGVPRQPRDIRLPKPHVSPSFLSLCPVPLSRPSVMHVPPSCPSVMSPSSGNIPASFPIHRRVSHLPRPPPTSVCLWSSSSCILRPVLLSIPPSSKCRLTRSRLKPSHDGFHDGFQLSTSEPLRSSPDGFTGERVSH